MFFFLVSSVDGRWEGIADDGLFPLKCIMVVEFRDQRPFDDGRKRQQAEAPNSDNEGGGSSDGDSDGWIVFQRGSDDVSGVRCHQALNLPRTSSIAVRAAFSVCASCLHVHPGAAGDQVLK